jgi:hypothetical protein
VNYVFRTTQLFLFALALLPNFAHGASLLSPGDFVIAIDVDPPASHSTYFLGEDALSGIDGNVGTKYGNFALPPIDTGLIVQPNINVGTVARSIQFTTANESDHRDPTGWKLYGTNDSISSVDNGTGMGENWNLIAENAVDLPLDRITPGPIQNFSNSTAYDNYRIQITSLRGPQTLNGMQFAEVQLYTDIDAGGIGVFTAADNAIAFQLPTNDSVYTPATESPQNLIDINPPTSRYVVNEAPQFLIDGLTTTKYFNFGAQNAGFIVTPQDPAQVQSFKVASVANAGATPMNRYPTSWLLYGTNDPILSTDNSKGIAENWSFIDQGSIPVPDPFTTETYTPAIPVSNANTYSSYKMLWPTTLSPTATGVHLSEAQFFTTADGTGTEILHTSPAATILAVDPDNGTPQDAKYYNRGENNSGFIVTPSVGASIVTGFQISSADGNVERDPTTWMLYGTNDTIVSQDNSQGNGESWALITQGTFLDTELPMARKTQGAAVSFTNTDSYKSYRMVFPTVRDAATAVGMQISDVQFFGTILASPTNLGDYNDDGVVDAADYTVWRNALGASDESAINGNGDGGGITESDYLVWKSHYGATYPGSGGLSDVSNVPEPRSAFLALLGAALSMWRCGRPRGGQWKVT